MEKEKTCAYRPGIIGFSHFSTIGYKLLFYELFIVSFE